MMFVILFSFSFNAYAADISKSDIEDTNVISFEEIQNLFPDIPLREDGFVADYESECMSAYSADEKALSEILSQPVESYDAEYNGGICTLNIYDNGIYGVAGYEKLDSKTLIGLLLQAQQVISAKHKQLLCQQKCMAWDISPICMAQIMAAS